MTPSALPEGPSTPTALTTLQVAGRTVAAYRDGEGLDATLSPRPFLHPVRTLAGTMVTDALPVDHPWHLGAGVAIQDVGGTNLWGGRTYRRDSGYTWLDDHGHVEHLRFVERSAMGFTAELAWRTPDGRELLRERRQVLATLVDLPATDGGTGTRRGATDDTGSGWRLRLHFGLRNSTAEDLALGSPASNGRTGAGYGGFFWRLPSLTGEEVATCDARGEASVHGRAAPWLVVSGQVRAHDAKVTLVFAGTDEATRDDPWFVRLEGYPGVGSSLASECPVTLAPHTQLWRGIDVILLDGRVPVETAAGLVS